MSATYQSDYSRAMQKKIIWDETRCKAAALLALAHTYSYVADQVGVHRNTIGIWMDDPDFAAEVDRLTMMTGVANRSERIRLAMRVIRSKMDERGVPQTTKDVLDWLKFAQSETDGAKIDLSKLAELLTGNDEQPAIDITPGPGHQSLLSEPATTDLARLAPQPVVATDNDDHNQ